MGKTAMFMNGKDQWDLADVKFFPPNPRLKYDDVNRVPGKNQLIADATNFVKKVYPGSQLQIVGNIGRAGMLVILQHENVYRAFLKISPTKRDTSNNPIFWQMADFSAATKMTSQMAQAKTAMTPLDPSDIITPGESYGIDELITKVDQKMQSAGVDPALAKGTALLLRQVQVGSPKLIPDMTQFRPVVEVKLGEIAAPIAMLTGHMCTGQYKDAEESLLKPLGLTFNKLSTISFPGRAEKLIDSYLDLPDGRKLAISSKDSSGGAKPSTATIADVLKTKADEFAADPTFAKRFATIQAAILTLDTLSGVDGPIKLAMTFQYITKEDAAYLKAIYSKGKVTDRMLKKNSPNLYQLIKSADYSPDETHPEYQTGYHILTVLAKMVAARLNKNAKLTTAFFKAVLNKSDMVQVLAKTAINGSAMCYKEFKIIYPPTFAGNIEVDANSGYTSRSKVTKKVGFTFRK